MSETNVAVKCNSCKRLYYRPESGNPCDLCNSNDIEVISDAEATRLFNETMAKSMLALK